MTVQSRLMVAGNWKMNTTVEEGVALARAVCAVTAPTDEVDVALLPPFTHLWAVHPVLAGSGVLLGAQNVYWKDSGAFTGEISPSMLAAGATSCSSGIPSAATCSASAMTRWERNSWRRLPISSG